MTEQERINDIVSKLDMFVTNGGGHMNVIVESEEDLAMTEEVKVEQYKSIDCSKGNLACAVPTIHKGIDDDSETV